MAIPKKPIDTAEAEAFIGRAKSATEPQRNKAKPSKRDNGKPSNSNKGKITKMTFYMKDDMYLRWKKYELKQIEKGKKISFQKIVEDYLNRIM